MKPADALALPAPEETPESDRLPQSLFGEILDWMLAPLLFVWPLSVGVTYLVASSIADAPFDDSLGRELRQIAVQIEQSRPESVSVPSHLRPGTSLQISVPSMRRTLGDADVPPVADDSGAAAEPSVRFRDEAVRGSDVRVASLALDGPVPMTLQLTESRAKRNQLAHDIVKGVILPQFVILPIAVVLVWFGLARGIRPLSRLQEKIQARKADDLRPIDPAEAPEELAPLVTAFNQLLHRLDGNVRAQKRFIADAAHQMKTPLAGLRTQAELALRETDALELHRSLQQIATATERATRLINQLLALAGAENATLQRFEPLDFTRLVVETVRDWVSPALEKRLDLSLDVPDHPVPIEGNAVLLKEMVGNLMDNAIRYTPPEGSIAVRLSSKAKSARLSIEDNGPGVPAADHARVFEPFYRVIDNGSEGSGLGLAIVREIAHLHRGTVAMASSERYPQGTTVTVALETSR